MSVGCTRGEHQGGVARVEMGEIPDVVGDHRAAAAGVVGPAVDVGPEKGTVDDQLAPAFEELQQVHPAVRRIEFVLLVHCQPRHAPPHGRQRIMGAQHLLLLDQQPLMLGRPLLRRHDRWCVHCVVRLSI